MGLNSDNLFAQLNSIYDSTKITPSRKPPVKTLHFYPGSVVADFIPFPPLNFSWDMNPYVGLYPAGEYFQIVWNGGRPQPPWKKYNWKHIHQLGVTGRLPTLTGNTGIQASYEAIYGPIPAGPWFIGLQFRVVVENAGGVGEFLTKWNNQLVTVVV